MRSRVRVTVRIDFSAEENDNVTPSSREHTFVHYCGKPEYRNNIRAFTWFRWLQESVGDSFCHFELHSGEDAPKVDL